MGKGAFPTGCLHVASLLWLAGWVLCTSLPQQHHQTASDEFNLLLQTQAGYLPLKLHLASPSPSLTSIYKNNSLVFNEAVI